MAWGAFSKATSGSGGSRFLNIAQVGGSAGMAVTAGVIFTAPLIQVLYADKGLPVPPVDVKTLIYVSIAGALIGYGFVGLTTKFLTDPSLPAPEARACESMIEAAVADPDKKPALKGSLFLGLLLSFLAPLMHLVGFAKDHVVLKKRGVGDHNFSVDLPFAPIYIGIGGLLTLATALLVFGGSFLRLIGDYLLATIDPANSEAMLAFPANSMRWVGGGAMTVAVAYSLVRFLGKRKAAAGEQYDESLLEMDWAVRRGLVGAVVVGVGMLIDWLIFKEGSVDAFSLSMGAAILMCSLMVTLGAILSLQIGSSASPVSGTIFVTTLVLCLVALATSRHELSDIQILTPLLVGACVAVCAANDSSQDYKTMQLCGVPVREGFLAQLLGLLASARGRADRALRRTRSLHPGIAQTQRPQGKMFARLIDGLLLQSALPWKPIYIGLGIGVLAVAMDILAGKRGLQLPSMALAVGIYLPPSLGVGILIGAFFRWLGERGTGKQRSESILAAAGLITGAGAFELILGIGILSNFDPETAVLFGEGQRMAWSESAAKIAGVLGILGLGALLFVNSRPKVRA
ncbi:MAG: OPT/YSL family transporter [Planctomycetota bacterium]